MIERIYFWRKLWNATQGHLISLVYFIQSSKMTPHFNTILIRYFISRRETISACHSDTCVGYLDIVNNDEYCAWQDWNICQKLLNWEKRSFSLFASNGIYFFPLLLYWDYLWYQYYSIVRSLYINSMYNNILSWNIIEKKKNIWPRGDSNIYLHTYFTYIINI